MTTTPEPAPTTTPVTTPADPVATATGPTATDLTYLQDALAAEQTAVYLYGVLGARTSSSAAPELYAAIGVAYVEHRTRRDDLTARVATAGLTPTPAATAYRFPDGTDLTTTTGVSAAAAVVEAACSSTYATIVGFTTGSTRELAVGWLNMTAVRELAFRGTPEMFPGAGEYADR